MFRSGDGLPQIVPSLGLASLVFAGCIAVDPSFVESSTSAGPDEQADTGETSADGQTDGDDTGETDGDDTGETDGEDTGETDGEDTGGTDSDDSDQEQCGDGLVDLGEACDDGNNQNGDYCSADCSQVTGSCGDGVVQTNEECDDENDITGDGCKPDCSYEWWDQGWKCRRKLSVNPGTVAEALTDFSVALKLNADRIDYAVMQENGADIRFVDSDAVTQLPYEVERWNPTGQSMAWAQLPELSATRISQYVWMYYGNPLVELQDLGPDTWDDDFAAVWHLESARDSTRHGWDCSNEGTTKTKGQLGRARKFEGAEYLDCGLEEEHTPQFTLEAWVRADAIDQTFQPVVTKGDTELMFQVTHNDVFELAMFDEHPLLGGFKQALTDDDTVPEVWSYMAASYDGERLRLYRDGVPQARTDTVRNRRLNDLPLNIGHSATYPDRKFVGKIDEVRMSTTVRSDEWVRVQHLSMTDQLLAYSDQECLDR